MTLLVATAGTLVACPGERTATIEGPPLKIGPPVEASTPQRPAVAGDDAATR